MNFNASHFILNDIKTEWQQPIAKNAALLFCFRWKIAKIVVTERFIYNRLLTLVEPVETIFVLAEVKPHAVDS